MGLRSDMKGGTNVNSTASGNTKDSDISYSVSATSSSGNYGNLNQVSGFGSLNSSYGPWGFPPRLATTIASNIPPVTAVAWCCILAA